MVISVSVPETACVLLLLHEYMIKWVKEVMKAVISGETSETVSWTFSRENRYSAGHRLTPAGHA